MFLKDKFMDFKEIVNTKDKWIVVTHVNDSLKLKHDVILKISKSKKISNRLYVVGGCYAETMYDLVSGNLIYKKMRNNEDFILSALNICFGNHGILDDITGDILFSEMSKV